MTDIARERRLLSEQGLEIITREDWDAVQPYTSDRAVNEPVEGFFLHISVTIDAGNTGLTEADDMRDIERIGVERFGRDSAGNIIGYPYNAAIFDTGRLYEGQPLTRRGAHTVNDEHQAGYVEPPGSWSLNWWYRAIVLPQLVTDDVTDAQVDQCARWAAAQIRAGMARRDATWHGHRDVSPKSCPGDTGYAQLPRIRTLTEHYVRIGLVQPQQEDDMELVYHFTHPGTQVRRTVKGGTVFGWSSGADRANWEAMVEKQIADRTGRPFQVPTLVLSGPEAFAAHTAAHRIVQGPDLDAIEASVKAIEADLADEEPIPSPPPPGP